MYALFVNINHINEEKKKLYFYTNKIDAVENFNSIVDDEIKYVEENVLLPNKKIREINIKGLKKWHYSSREYDSKLKSEKAYKMAIFNELPEIKHYGKLGEVEKLSEIYLFYVEKNKEFEV